MTAQLHPEGDRTRVTVDTDLKIVGKLAQFGSSMLQQVSEKLLGQFVEALEEKLAATAPAAPQPEETEAPDRAAQTAAAEPRPIDLLELAGGGALTKYAPAALAIAALLVVWLVLGRRCRHP